jgi:DNA-binding LacI/PurR family transcriptional regulator
MTNTFLKHSSKTQALCQHLTGLAQQLGPDAKLPTMQELRRELGVSIATLDSALTKLESQKVIYRKHGVGVFVSPRLGEKCVGLVVDPEFFQAGSSPFWQELIEGTRARAAAKGESFRFYVALAGRDGLPVKEDLAEDVHAGRLDGILFIGANEPAVQWIEAQGVPVACFAGSAPHKVQLNYETLIEQGVHELKRQGCRRLALIKKLDWRRQYLVYPQLSDLGQLFIEQLKQNGLALEPRFVQDAAYYPSDESNQMQGFEAINRLWAEPNAERPDGLLITDDMMTRGALVGLEKCGVRIGTDIQIVSHINGGSTVLHGYEDTITLIQYDITKVVSALFELLEACMAGVAGTSSTVYVEPELKSPYSTGAAI